MEIETAEDIIALASRTGISVDDPRLAILLDQQDELAKFRQQYGICCCPAL
jgi:hypothetical protein